MKTLILTLLLSGATIATCQARPANCQVRPLWAIKDGVRSANLGPIGEFRVDGSEGVTERSFKFEDTGLVITTAVNYQFDYSRDNHKPSRIELAITVSDQEKKHILESVDSSEASTAYQKNWNLQVTKNISFDNRTYMFTLSCQDKSAKTKVAGESPATTKPTNH